MFSIKVSRKYAKQSITRNVRRVYWIQGGGGACVGSMDRFSTLKTSIFKMKGYSTSSGEFENIEKMQNNKPEVELYELVQEGNFEKCKMFIQSNKQKKGFNIDKTDSGGSSPLNYAVLMAREDLVELLLKENADPNHSTHSIHPIYACANSTDKYEIAKLLIKYGADVNSVSDCGAKPLQIAQISKNKKMCDLLIAHGANADPLYGR